MTAVTPRLWVEDCHFDHVACASVEGAAQALAEGATVVVPSFEVAQATLETFGAPADEIAYRIDQARRRNEAGIVD